MTHSAQFNGVDGARPKAELIQANNGNLYGTTSIGGAYTEGSVFSLSGSLGLTLSVAKVGSGTVISNDGFITCGDTCSHSYGSGTTVTMTATAAQGWRFGSWSGCDSVQSNICTVTMNTFRTVTATFIAQYTLSVADTGTGTGTVTSSDGKINCGTMCSYNYDGGTMVTLTATPSQDSSFTGWSGCDSVQSNVCTVTMSSARAVNAIFSLIVPNPLRFVPVTPCRSVDTRPQHGGNGPIFGNTSQSFVIPGTCGIPTTAAAYSLNITVVPHGSLGYLTVWPTGFVAAVGVDAELGGWPGQGQCGYRSGRSQRAISIIAYGHGLPRMSLWISMGTSSASDTTALAFYPLTPCRVVDTRLHGSLGGPTCTPGADSRLPDAGELQLQHSRHARRPIR